MSNSKEYHHIESIYWVFTQLCNDHCMHCYNNSGPEGDRITTEECMAVIDNLPGSAGRIILSGGELGNVCKWCDEFFSVHYDIKRNCSRHKTGRTEVSV